MSQEQVLSVWIGDAPNGLATVQVVARTSSGERTITRRRGEVCAMRAFVQDLAGRHDLVPIWDDDSWMSDGSRRPPAPFYTSRELAPPPRAALAS
jgi:hypothetical protein